MRSIMVACVLMGASLGLAGCAVAQVGGAVIGAGASVVGTAVDVAGDVVTAPLGGDNSDDDKKSK